jgi:hypothetical protein
VPVVDGKVKLHIFVDRNTVELFGADYTVAGSVLIYPPIDCKGVEVFSNNGSAVANIEIYPLKSIWKKSGSGLGINEQPVKKNGIDIQLTGKTLRVFTLYRSETNVKIYNILGNLLKDFGTQRKDEYSLSFLLPGIYIVSVKTPGESKSRKIILNDKL